MNGSWHIYRPGREVADAGAGDAHPDRDGATGSRSRSTSMSRSSFGTADLDRAPAGRDARAGSARRLRSGRALERIRAQGARAVHEVLLDQRVIAGIGNVYKSEILFLSTLHPDTPAAAVSDEAWRELLTLAQSLLRANVADGAVGHRDLSRPAPHDRPHESRGSPVGLQPRRPALSHVRHAYREPQRRRRRARYVLVSSVSGCSPIRRGTRRTTK